VCVCVCVRENECVLHLCFLTVHSMRMVDSRNPFFFSLLLLTPRYFLCHVCVFIWVPACACLKWGSHSSPYLFSLLDTRFLVLLMCSVSPLISAACGIQEVWLGQVWPNRSIWNETCPLNFRVRCLWGMFDSIVACVRVNIRSGVKERGEMRVRLCLLAF